jgi:uncharacterized protein involved in response to NO
MAQSPVTNIEPAGRRYAGPAVLSFGFRPFFLCGALYAGLAIPIWAMLFTGRLVPTAESFDPLRWHAHEMVFGFLGAIVAGFLLTAIPNWTGRLPVSGARLGLLVALWLLGRVGFALLAIGAIGPALALVLELPYWIALGGAAFREVIAGQNRRNLPVVALLSGLGVADLVSFLPDWTEVTPLLGVRLALAIAAVMIALIGGRVTPSFTRNWLAKEKGEPFPAAFGPIDKAAVAVTLIAMLAWAFLPEQPLVGAALLLAGAVQAVRLARWQGQRTLAEPLVTILHLGYLWLVLALLALGAAALWPEAMPPSPALHALTAGAVGTMTLAVMTRATLGHTGRALHADGLTRVIYGLVILGAATRVAAGWLPTDYAETAACGGVLWSAAFLLFAAKYGPYLLMRRA